MWLASFVARMISSVGCAISKTFHLLVLAEFRGAVLKSWKHLIELHHAVFGSPLFASSLSYGENGSSEVKKLGETRNHPAIGQRHKRSSS